MALLLAVAAEETAELGAPCVDPNWKLMPVGRTPVSPLAFTTPNAVTCTAQNQTSQASSFA